MHHVLNLWGAGVGNTHLVCGGVLLTTIERESHPVGSMLPCVRIYGQVPVVQFGTPETQLPVMSSIALRLTVAVVMVLILSCGELCLSVSLTYTILYLPHATHAGIISLDSSGFLNLTRH